MPKVLLADDDSTMVTLLQTLLGMEGYQVATLLDKTGNIVENIRHEKPDILLMDVYLGTCYGVDIARKIRALPDMKDLKIVMVSGVDKTAECLAAGANAFLLKPYMPDTLFDLLRA